MALESSAFCPGHVTAFFEPVEHADPYKKGSRGAGLSLSLGVKTRVKARLGRKPSVRAYLNREEVPAPTTRWAAIAHAAEVASRTGLGDVVPASLGAMDIRLQPGAPPHAVVRRLPADGDVLLAVLGAPIPTRAVLTNAAKLRPIAEVGGRCVKEFAKNPTLPEMFRLGRGFAVSTV